MAALIREGTVVFLQSEKEGKYIFSIPASYSKGDIETDVQALNFFTSTNEDEPHPHFASFQIVLEKPSLGKDLVSPLFKWPLKNCPQQDDAVGKEDLYSPRKIVFGQQIKLRHVASGLYLSVGDKDCLSLVSEYKDQDGLFKMLQDPNEHIRENKEICSNDKVVLQSVGHRGYYIRCFPSNVIGSNENNDYYVFKLSYSPVTVFNIHCHTSTDYISTGKFPHPRAIRGGSIIQLRNKERHAYIACATHDYPCHLTPDNANNSFTITITEDQNNDQEIIAENQERVSVVGARQKWVHNGIHRPPPVSGDSWWQLEILKRKGKPLEELKVFKGSPVEYGDICCLKHVPTQQYMKFGKVNAQFVIQSAKNPKLSSEVVLKESMIRLKLLVDLVDGDNCEEDSRYLKIDPTRCKWITKHSENRRVGSRWLDVHPINSTLENNPFNTFVVDEVKPEYIHMLYYILGVKNALRDISRKKEWLTVLNDLKHYLDLKRTRFNAKACVKMLRNCEVVDILVKFLENEDRNIQNLVIKILTCLAKTPSHRLLTVLGCDRNLEIFFAKIRDGIKVEGLIEELVKNERSIGNSAIIMFFNHLENSSELLKKASYLNLLSSLCFPGGQPFKPAQDLVYRKMIHPHIHVKEPHNQHFLKTTCNLRQGTVYLILETGQEEPLGTKFDQDKQLQERFVAQMKLFCNVCKGVNIDIITELTQLNKPKKSFSYEECYFALKDNSIDLGVRCAYLDFLLSVYIDKRVFDESGIEIDGIWNCYSKIRFSDNEDLDLANIKSDLTLGFKPDLLEFFEDKIKNYTRAQNEDKLFAKILEAYQPLVAYGFCWTLKLGFGLNYFINILKVSSDNKIRVWLVKILHTFFKQLCIIGVTRFLKKFIICEQNRQAEPLLIDNFKIQNCNRATYVREMKEFHTWLKTYFCFDVSSTNGQELVKILKDKLLFSDNDELKMCSARLLFDMYSIDQIIFDGARNAYIHIPDEDQPDTPYDRMIREGSFFKDRGNNEQSSLKSLLLGNDKGFYPTTREEIVFVIKLFQEYMYVDGCKFDIDEDGYQYKDVTRHAPHQHVALTTGVFRTLMKYILKFSEINFRDVTQIDDHETEKELFRVSCDTLCEITRGNNKAKRKVFLHFDDILKLDIAVSSVASLLTQTLTNNADECHKVDEHTMRNLYTRAMSKCTFDIDTTTLANVVAMALPVTMQDILNPPRELPVSKGHKVKPNRDYYAVVFKCLRHLDDPSGLYTETLKLEFDERLITRMAEMFQPNPNESEVEIQVNIAQAIIDVWDCQELEAKLKEQITQLNQLLLETERLSTEQIEQQFQKGAIPLHCRLMAIITILNHDNILTKAYKESFTKLQVQRQPCVSYYNMIQPVSRVLELDANFVAKYEKNLATVSAVMETLNLAPKTKSVDREDFFPHKLTEKEFLYTMIVFSDDTDYEKISDHITKKMLKMNNRVLKIEVEKKTIRISTGLIEKAVKYKNHLDGITTQDSYRSVTSNAFSAGLASVLREVEGYNPKLSEKETINLYVLATTEHTDFFTTLETIIMPVVYPDDMASVSCDFLKDKQELVIKLFKEQPPDSFKMDEPYLQNFIKLLQQLHNFVDIGQDPVDIDQDPVDIDQDPVDIDQDPVDIDQDPVDIDQDPVDIDQDPVDIDQDPVDIDQDPVDIDQDPVDIDQDPVDIDQDPVDIDQDPVNIGQDPSMALSRDALQFFSVSNLLSYCCKNDCNVAETECRQIFSLDDLISIIKDDTIGPVLKVPFVNLLIELYIDTEQETREVVDKLSSTEDFWKFLEKHIPEGPLNLTENDEKKKKLHRYRYMLRRIFSGHFSSRCMLELAKDDWISKVFFTIKAIVPLVGALNKGITSLFVSQKFLPDKLISLCERINSLYVKVKISLLDADSTYDVQLILTMSVQTQFWKTFIEDVEKIIVVQALTRSIQNSESAFEKIKRCLEEVYSLYSKQQYTQFWTFFLNNQDIQSLLRNGFPTVVTDNTETLNNTNGYKSEAITKYETNISKEIKLSESLRTYISNYETVVDKLHVKKSNSPIKFDGIRRFGGLAKLFIKCDKLTLATRAFHNENSDSKKALEPIENIEESLTHLFELLNIIDRHSHRMKTSEEIDQLNKLLEHTLQVISSVLYNFKHESLDALNLSQKFQAVILHTHSLSDVVEHYEKKLKERLVWSHESSKSESVVSHCQKALVHFSHPCSEVTVQVLVLLDVILSNETHDAIKNYFIDDPVFFQRILLLIAPFHKHLSSREGITDGQLERYGEQASTVLDMVCTLCDGQKLEMQNLLRHQKDVFVPVNIVHHIASLLDNLSRNILKLHNIQITKKALQALIEVCSGNYENQIVAINSQVLDAINLLIAPDESTFTLLLKMKCKAVELLEILMEDTTSTYKNMIFVISEGINQKHLIRLTKDLYDLHMSIKKSYLCGVKRKVSPFVFAEAGQKDLDKIENTVEDGMFRSYHILRKFSDELETDFKETFLDDDGEPIDKDMERYLRKRSYSVEINYKNILTQVYFPFEYSKELTDEQKAIIQDDIKRDTPKDKAQDLIEWTKSVHKQYEHLNPKSKKKEKLIVGLLALSTIRHLFLCFLTIFLSILVLFGLSVPSSTIEAQSHNASRAYIIWPHDTAGYKAVLISFGLWHLFFSIWMVSEYFFKNIPYFRFCIQWIQEELYALKSSVQKYNFFNKRQIIDGVKALKKRNQIVCFFSGWFKKPEEIKCFDIAFFSSITPIYMIIFLLSSLFSIIFSGYFYCLCLPYVLIRINVIQTILKALGGRAKQLFFVGLLISFILYIYTIISFVFMYNFFDRDESLFCQNTGECFITVVREGLFNSFSSIPVKYTGQAQPSFEVYFFRAVIDVSFFVIIAVIALNVIVAVLVDRFSELREAKEKALQDSKDFCFVCGIKSEYFEKQDPGFAYHYRKEHSMYHYMYYYLYLQRIPQLDQNAVQRYVSKCVEEDSIKYIPLQKAKVFGGKVPSEAIQESQASILSELKEIKNISSSKNEDDI